MDKIKINLAAGNRSLKGYANQDIQPNKNIELVFDLNNPWPIGDNSVDRYICLNALQYLQDPVYFLREVQRTLKPYSYITLEVPHAWTLAADIDPLAKHKFLPDYFKQFQYTGGASLLPDHFRVLKLEVLFNPKVRWLARKIIPKLPFKNYGIFSTIRVTLKKLSIEEYEIIKIEKGD